MLNCSEIENIQPYTQLVVDTHFPTDLGSVKTPSFVSKIKLALNGNVFIFIPFTHSKNK